MLRKVCDVTLFLQRGAVFHLVGRLSVEEGVVGNGMVILSSPTFLLVASLVLVLRLLSHRASRRGFRVEVDARRR